MKVWQLKHSFGGRNEFEPYVDDVGLFASPEAALRRVREEWPEAPDWPVGSMMSLEVVPFKDSKNADKPCEGEWWTLMWWEVAE